MDIELKMWNYTNTGTKVHAFINGKALCRSSIRRQTAEGQGLDYCNAKSHPMCGSCETKFNAAIERAEASMQPSTGEGDYHPPAAQITVSRAAVEAVRNDTTRPEGSKYSTPEYRAMMAERTKESDARNGIVRKYVLEDQVTETPDPTPEENDMPDLTGPLTDRQWSVLRGISAGHRYVRIARNTKLSLSTVKHEAANITAKFGAETVPQAVARSATANAYKQAAELLLAGRIPSPVDGTERHVNQVLEGLAGILRERADRLIPQ